MFNRRSERPRPALGATSDPRAFLNADPAAIHDYAKALEADGKYWDVRGNLLNRTRFGDWHGRAADNAQERLNGFVSDYRRTSTAADYAAEHVRTYAYATDTAMGQIRNAIAEYDAAEQERVDAERAGRQPPPSNWDRSLNAQAALKRALDDHQSARERVTRELKNLRGELPGTDRALRDPDPNPPAGPAPAPPPGPGLNTPPNPYTPPAGNGNPPPGPPHTPPPAATPPAYTPPPPLPHQPDTTPPSSPTDPTHTTPAPVPAPPATPAPAPSPPHSPPDTGVYHPAPMWPPVSRYPEPADDGWYPRPPRDTLPTEPPARHAPPPPTSEAPTPQPAPSPNVPPPDTTPPGMPQETPPGAPPGSELPRPDLPSPDLPGADLPSNDHHAPPDQGAPQPPVDRHPDVPEPPATRTDGGGSRFGPTGVYIWAPVAAAGGVGAVWWWVHSRRKPDEAPYRHATLSHRLRIAHRDRPDQPFEITDPVIGYDTSHSAASVPATGPDRVLSHAHSPDHNADHRDDTTAADDGLTPRRCARLALVLGERGADTLGLDLIPEPCISLHGPGAAGALRAAIATGLCQGYRVLIPEADAATLIGPKPPAAVPDGLCLTADLDDALTRLSAAEEEAAATGDYPPAALLILTAPPQTPEQAEQLARFFTGGTGAALILDDPDAPAALTIDTDSTVTATRGPAAAHLGGACLFTVPFKYIGELLFNIARPEGYPAPEPVVASAASRASAHTAAPPAGQADSTAEGAAGEPAGGADQPGAGSESSTNAQPAPEATSAAADASAQPRQEPLADLRLEILNRVRFMFPRTATPTDPKPEPLVFGLPDAPRQLAAYLALNPNGQTRAAIAATLWEDSSSNRPTAVLTTTASRLNRHVEKATDGAITNIFQTTGDGLLRLHPDIKIDYWEYLNNIKPDNESDPVELAAAHKQALAHYHGQLAENVDAEWLHSHRANFLEHVTRNTLTLAGKLKEQHPKKALALLVQALEFDEYQESLYRAIIEIHDETGQHDAARKASEHLLVKLDELDAQPTPQTMQLLSKIAR